MEEQTSIAEATLPKPPKRRRKKKVAATLDPNQLWQYYQRGYLCLMRNGLYFRQILRPALSHVYFQCAVPILRTYARANQNEGDLPPGFGDQMQACPLTLRDLLHLDYAICLGYADALRGRKTSKLEDVMDWPGPGGFGGFFIASDAILSPTLDLEEEMLEEEMEDDDDDGPMMNEPPFDI